MPAKGLTSDDPAIQGPTAQTHREYESARSAQGPVGEKHAGSAGSPVPLQIPHMAPNLCIDSVCAVDEFVRVFTSESFLMLPRILIVDSNRVIRGFIRSILATRAAEIREATDGNDAVAQYASWHPDIVLMEIRMPRMDGLDATRAIRALDPCATIIIVTDYDVAGYRSAASEAGAADYVLKEHLLLLPDLIGDIGRHLRVDA